VLVGVDGRLIILMLLQHGVVKKKKRSVPVRHTNAHFTRIIKRDSIVAVRDYAQTRMI